MARIYDRVQETSTTTGTGALALTGAVLGYRTFLSVNSGATFDEHYYTITDQTASADWEVGIGTYDTTTNTLSRDTVLSSSNGNALVNFTSGALYVFATYPADRGVYVDSGLIVANANIPAVLALANGGTNAATSTAAFANIKGLTVNLSGASINLDDGFEYYQIFTGGVASQARLPNPVGSVTVGLGFSFCIINNSTVAAAIRNSTGATLYATIPPGVTVECVLVDATVNTAASWKFNWWFPQASTTGSVLLTSPTLAAGLATAARAPLKYTSGTNLTTVEAGAKEYDGVVFFSTPNTTSGRAYQPSTHIFRLAANGAAIGPAIANFFGATSAINLVANGFYEIEAHCYFLKTTADIVTVTVTTSVAPLNLNGNIQTGAVTGGTATGAAQQIALFNSTATGSAFGATGTLTTGVNHYMKISLIVDAAASNSNLRINFTSGSGTVTPLRGSYYKTTRLPAANTGIFAA
jgi:hypothetical protein